MSSLEEKLKRISGELKAYNPQEESSPREGGAASCMLETTRGSLEEAADGLLASVSAEALHVLCRSGGFEGWDIARAAFVDTETTGLAGGSGTVAFLIGLGYVSGDEFVVEQYFMQDYDVEAEMLARLCKKLQGFDYLVTFNGKCFDAPLIASRSVINRIRQPLDDMEQVDLLHAARRIYKKRLKRCDLQTLEREVLGREREQDVPGSLVPVMFFEYLRSGDFEPMKLVLEHNRRDIVSLLTLLCRLCHAVRQPEELVYADDVYSCGRLQERMGNFAEAERCYRLAATGADGPKRELSLLLKRLGRVDEAAEIWRELAAQPEFLLFSNLELAKYFEHRAGDPAGALDAVERCVVKLRAMGVEPDNPERQALARRRERLLAKLGRGA